MRHIDDPSVVALRTMLEARDADRSRDGAQRWTPDRIAALLRQDVLHQEGAITEVAAVLAVSQRGLTMRRDRPQAIFLFHGPTGCGKTELARSIRMVTNRDERTIIRHDMTEFADQTAVGRLIGSNRGYVGFDSTAMLLSTQVITHPDAVVILDEFEKCHPAVQMLFLQVFDRGTLTDGHGRIARFNRTIVVLTTNLGITAQRRPVGFIDAEVAAVRKPTSTDAVRAALRPELVGRIDAIVRFDALDDVARCAIARHHIDRWTAAITRDHWYLEVPDAVITHIVSLSDARDGARGLQRTIDRYLVTDLLGRSPGGYVAVVDGGNVVWQARASSTTPPNPTRITDTKPKEDASR